MVEFIQYPHVLKATYESSEAVRDGNGDWVTGGGIIIMNGINCRVQPNSKANTITGTDGEKVVFDSIIYAEGKLDTIPFGAKIEIFEGEERILSAHLLRFSRDSFHSRIWV